MGENTILPRRARLKINNKFSEWMPLERGTRQGCPLSPLLFALAMEPLAEAVRTSTGVKGFKRSNGEEKIALYADDVLLFLGDMGSSLEKVIQLVERFGSLSGLIVNWGKSTLLPIDSTINAPTGYMSRLRVTEKTKYLGIVVSSDPYQYIGDNLVPLLAKFKRKSDIWGQLPLSMAGRTNLVNMIWMPQLLYVLHNSPVWIGKKCFFKINTLFRELIWRKGQARISLQTLQRPVREGGMAVPQPYNYFLATQLQQIGGCESQAWRDFSGEIMLQDNPHNFLVEALEAGSLQDRSPT